MKNIGIGVDIESITSIKNLLQKYSELEWGEFFSQEEIILSRNSPLREKFLSICFSAKESVYKSLGKFQILFTSFNEISVTVYQNNLLSVRFLAGILSELLSPIVIGTWLLSDNCVWTSVLFVEKSHGKRF